MWHRKHNDVELTQQTPDCMPAAGLVDATHKYMNALVSKQPATHALCTVKYPLAEMMSSDPSSAPSGTSVDLMPATGLPAWCNRWHPVCMEVQHAPQWREANQVCNLI
jgi:hypothetical protein